MKRWNGWGKGQKTEDRGLKTQKNLELEINCTEYNPRYQRR